MQAFENNLDRYHTSPPYVAQLLERGVDVLVYVGECVVHLYIELSAFCHQV